MGLENEKLQRELEKALTKAAAIVEAEAKERCPYSTGNLRRSITHEVNYPEAIIGSNVEYAP